jgi:hypothetical protein
MHTDPHTDQKGWFREFIEEIRYDGVLVTGRRAGIKGLLFMHFLNRDCAAYEYGDSAPFFNLFIPPFRSEMIERDSEAIITYTSIEEGNYIPTGALVVRFIFSKEKPFITIITKVRKVVEDIPMFNVGYAVIQAIGGSHNLKNRVVIPVLGDKPSDIYIINGNANGLHYLPRYDTWSLRMGAEDSPHKYITTGWFVKDSSWVKKGWGYRQVRDGTYIEWPCCHKIYPDRYDDPPYGLDRIYGNTYYIYQEDEAGANYSWQHIQTHQQPLNVEGENTSYYSEIYYWVGEDRYDVKEYGHQKNNSYVFNIKRWMENLRCMKLLS